MSWNEHASHLDRSLPPVSSGEPMTTLCGYPVKVTPPDPDAPKPPTYVIGDAHYVESVGVVTYSRQEFVAQWKRFLETCRNDSGYHHRRCMETLLDYETTRAHQMLAAKFKTAGPPNESLERSYQEAQRHLVCFHVLRHAIRILEGVDPGSLVDGINGASWE